MFIMSVLNQSGEEQVECPLCMEPLEVDDLNFFPCTCGYQICRFCWHRIRTDENGLCPACRKAYSENPADFTPLSKEQVAQLKAEKRQRDQQRKAKLSESRKHLASVRVVQRNLVFVVGLPMRLADPEVLKKHEYFGKFGKIHKVVINQSTAYAGTQGPSASAYVTYMKSDDALRAIQSVNNTTLDGKTIKTSLGTTKYCSHFMKNQSCPKPDCMYLHDFGDQEASFTKEQMHAGKHQEYEKKLHEALQARLLQQQQQAQVQPMVITSATDTLLSSNSSSSSSSSSTASSSPSGIICTTSSTAQQQGQNNHTATTTTTATSNGNSGNASNGKEGTWPQLQLDGKENGSKKSNSDNRQEKNEKSQRRKKNQNNESSRHNSKRSTVVDDIREDIRVKEKDGKEKERLQQQQQQLDECKEKECAQNNRAPHNSNKISNEIVYNNNNVTINGDANEMRNDKLSQEHDSEKQPLQIAMQPTEELKQQSLIDDNSSFFTQNSFGCKLPPVDDDPRRLNGHHHELDINDTDAWDFDFGYTNHSNHLEELAKQRVSTNVKDPLDESFYNLNMLDPFGKLDAFMEDNLLESITKNSASYLHPQQQQQPPQPPQVHQSRHFLNGHKDMVQEQQQNAFPKIFDFYRNMLGPQQQQQQQQSLLNGLHSQSNGFHNGFPQQQQQPQPPQPPQQTHYNHLSLEKHLAMLHQRQIEENLLNLSLGKQIQQQQQQRQHGFQMGGHYDHVAAAQSFNLGTFGSGNISNSKSNRAILDDKEMDFRFQETQKSLEALVESDGHSAGRNQLNGGMHNSQNHLPPPPPGFVQSNSHMNSFGSKILPFLKMNNQQQQQPQQQPPPLLNNWTNQFNQLQQQQQTQHNNKAMGGVCNDWKVLDPAILSSRRHIPSMGPLIDQYAPQPQQQQPPQPQQPQPPQQQQPPNIPNLGGNNMQPPSRSYDMYSAFANYANPLQQSFNSSNGYGTGNHLSGHHPTALSSWLGNELGAQISTPPGFRTSGQPTKQQQEC